jgi:pyruvate/2-oxoglutarate/acetoin dehydrogenase E1 component
MAIAMNNLVLMLIPPVYRASAQDTMDFAVDSINNFLNHNTKCEYRCIKDITCPMDTMDVISPGIG